MVSWSESFCRHVFFKRKIIVENIAKLPSALAHRTWISWANISCPFLLVNALTYRFWTFDNWNFAQNELLFEFHFIERVIWLTTHTRQTAYNSLYFPLLCVTIPPFIRQIPSVTDQMVSWSMKWYRDGMMDIVKVWWVSWSYDMWNDENVMISAMKFARNDFSTIWSLSRDSPVVQGHFYHHLTQTLDPSEIFR